LSSERHQCLLLHKVPFVLELGYLLLLHAVLGRLLSRRQEWVSAVSLHKQVVFFVGEPRVAEKRPARSVLMFRTHVGLYITHHRDRHIMRVLRLLLVSQHIARLVVLGRLACNSHWRVLFDFNSFQLLENEAK